MNERGDRDPLSDQLVAEVPALRAFARSLTMNHALADDLVQETVLKAWAKLGSFEPGTKMRAWLFTILRNTFLSIMRKRAREVEDVDHAHAARVVELPAQSGVPDLVDFKRAYMQLLPPQREALILVCAAGFTYDEAAEICGVAPGTVKSRVNRARKTLSAILPHLSQNLSSVEPVTMSVLGTHFAKL